MQDHAKQRYIFGHLSLIQSLALDIPNGVATMRDFDEKPLKKERFEVSLGESPLWETSTKSFPKKKKKEKKIRVPFKAPLFLGKWYGITTYFCLYKKRKRKNTNYKIHEWIVPFIDWIKLLI